MSNFFSSFPADEQAEMPTISSRRDARASEKRSKLLAYESQLLAIPGVEGCALDSEALVVYIRSQSAAKSLPSTLDGLTVRPVVTGEIRALDGL